MLERETVSIIIGISSGMGGALATVTAFLLALRGLEMRLKKVEAEMETKIDKNACIVCHESFERDLARGQKSFDGLFEAQHQAVQSLGQMDVTLRLLVQRVDALQTDFRAVTRIEINHGERL